MVPKIVDNYWNVVIHVFDKEKDYEFTPSENLFYKIVRDFAIRKKIEPSEEFIDTFEHYYILTNENLEQDEINGRYEMMEKMLKRFEKYLKENP